MRILHYFALRHVNYAMLFTGFLSNFHIIIDYLFFIVSKNIAVFLLDLFFAYLIAYKIVVLLICDFFLVCLF